MENLHFDFITLLLFSGIINGVLIIVLILARRPLSKTQKILLALIIFLVYDLLVYTYTYNKLFYKFPWLLSTNLFIPFIYSPLIYLYTRYKTLNQPPGPKVMFLMFIPAFIVFLFSVWLNFIPQNEKILFYFNARSRENGIINTLTVIIHFQWIFYTVLNFKMLVDFRKRIKDCFSNQEKKNLAWLLKINLFIFIIWSFAFALLVTEILGFSKVAYSADKAYYIYLLVAIFIFVLGFFGVIHNLPVLSQQTEKDFIMVDTNKEFNKDFPDSKNKYKRSGLTDEVAKEYLERLLYFMEENKPYLENDISLAQLASRIEISPNHLSEILNSKLNKNFFDFINNYRIIEVKKRLLDKDFDNFTILAVAYDCGFSSKTTFNTLFKKHTGKTPSQYRLSSFS